MSDQKKFECKVWWDDQEMVLRERIIGRQNADEAMKSVAEADKEIATLKSQGIKDIKFLFDASEAGTPSSEARKIFAAWAKRKTVDKIAIFGGGALQRTVAKFILGFADFGNMKYFATEAEALAWLKQSG